MPSIWVDRQTACPEMVEIVLLVQSAALDQYFQNRIPHGRFVESALSDCETKLCQIVAIEMPHQVRSAEMHYSINAQHGAELRRAGIEKKPYSF
jgi:hypothetical protein